MSEFVHYRLRREEIGKIIADQSLKKWWVAEFTGVHKTTLRRWLQGKIQFVRRDHLLKLAEVLATAPQAISEPVLRPQSTFSRSPE